MLEFIFQGFTEWLYEMALECWEHFLSALLDLLSLDFAYLKTHIPIIPDIMDIMLAVGWSLLLGNLVFQAIKSMMSGLGFDGEDPKLLFTRTFVFAFLLLASPQICQIGLDITSNIVAFLEMPDAVDVHLLDDSAFGSLTAAWLLVIICDAIVMFKVFRLLLEIVERYLVLAMLTITAPLAFATGGSRNTSEIFIGWCRMYGSMCVLTCLNVVFMKMLLSVLSSVPSGLGVIGWMVLVFAIVKVAKKANAIVTRIGLNPAITGDGLGRGLPGMLTYAVARNVASQVTKAAGKSIGGNGTGHGRGSSPHSPPPGTGPRTSGPSGGASSTVWGKRTKEGAGTQTAAKTERPAEHGDNAAAQPTGGNTVTTYSYQEAVQGVAPNAGKSPGRSPQAPSPAGQGPAAAVPIHSTPGGTVRQEDAAKSTPTKETADDHAGIRLTPISGPIPTAQGRLDTNQRGNRDSDKPSPMSEAQIQSQQKSGPEISWRQSSGPQQLTQAGDISTTAVQQENRRGMNQHITRPPSMDEMLNPSGKAARKSAVPPGMRRGPSHIRLSPDESRRSQRSGIPSQQVTKAPEAPETAVSPKRSVSHGTAGTVTRSTDISRSSKRSDATTRRTNMERVSTSSSHQEAVVEREKAARSGSAGMQGSSATAGLPSSEARSSRAKESSAVKPQKAQPGSAGKSDPVFRQPQASSSKRSGREVQGTEDPHRPVGSLNPDEKTGQSGIPCDSVTPPTSRPGIAGIGPLRPEADGARETRHSRKGTSERQTVLSPRQAFSTAQQERGSQPGASRTAGDKVSAAISGSGSPAPKLPGTARTPPAMKGKATPNQTKSVHRSKARASKHGGGHGHGR